MVRLIRFLLKLSAEEFYGDVRIRFRRGQVNGLVSMDTSFVIETLPEPDLTSPAYQKVLAEVQAGVELPT